MNRHPKGTPDGGKFAESARAEPSVDLDTVVDHQMQLTPATERVLATLFDSGAEPYLVGGCVRDSLMGGNSKDVDIEVYGSSADEIIKALSPIGKVDEVGRSFGIIKVRSGGEDFDVSLPRADSRNGAGHRGFDVHVDPDMSHQEATARRDFTINALMYDPATGRVLDYHGGVSDMRDGVLRHVSDAFAEDPLRVVRGIRFAARFDMDMHPDTIEFSRDIADQYASLPIDRIQKEFSRTYVESVAIERSLDLLRATSWQKNLPGLAVANTPVLRRQMASAQRLVNSGQVDSDRRGLILSAVVAHTIPHEQRYPFLNATTLGNGPRRDINNLIDAVAPSQTDSASIRSWAASLRSVTIRDWAMMHTALGDDRARIILDRAVELGVDRGPEAKILSGNDVIEVTGRKPGPWLSDFLSRAEQAQYRGDFTDLASAREWAKNA